MRNRYLFFAILFCFTVLNVFITPAAAQANVSEVWVSPEYSNSTEGWGVTHFSKIQEAVNGVSEKGIVIIGAGTYYENVRVEKSITLQAENAVSMPVIDAGGSGDVITLCSNEIKIIGLGIANGDVGIQVESNNNTITQCYLTDNCFRIKLSNSSGNTITENILNGKGEGISLYNGSNNNTIKSNTITGDYPDREGCTGIRLVQSSYNSVTNNYIEMFRGHILLTGSDFNVIDGNTLLKSWDISHPGEEFDFCGIILYAADNNTVINNNISEIAASGIRLFGASSNNVLKANKIENVNHAGIDLYYQSNNNHIINNEVGCSGYGIILDNASDNLIYRNSFSDNTQNAFSNSSNLWNYEGMGNFWSDYIGQDITENGIENSAYNILPKGRDSSPLTKPETITQVKASVIPEAPARETEDDWLFITTEEVWNNKNMQVKQPVAIMDGGRLTITDSTLQLLNAIHVWENGSLLIENTNLQVQTRDWAFINVESTGILNIVNSIITGKGQSILVQKGGRLCMEGSELNRLGGWSAALDVFADNAVIKGNIIRGSYDAITFQSSEGNSATDNIITDVCVGITSYGVDAGRNQQIKNNVFSNIITSGFIAVGTGNSTIAGNKFENIWGPAVAILPASHERGSKDNLIYENSFINCSVYDEEVNQWYYQGRGNYWGNYNERYPNAEVHSQYKGIWNTPYMIEGRDKENFDLYPLVDED